MSVSVFCVLSDTWGKPDLFIGIINTLNCRGDILVKVFVDEMPHYHTVIVDGVIRGQWSMVNAQCTKVNGQCFIISCS